MASHTPVGRLAFLGTLNLSSEERARIPVDTRGKFEWMSARYPSILVPEFPAACEVKREATERVNRIFTQWDKLHSILMQYEDVLRKRWIKKTQDQRKQVLLNAWPCMAQTHRPDFNALRLEKKEERRNGTRFRNEFLFPYINLEDLMKGNNLLLFFHSRGHNEPHVFSSYDRKTYRLGLTCNAIHQSYLEGYTMLLSGQSSIESYGKLLDWSSDKEAEGLLLIGIGDQPGEGLITLEIQDRILHFLIDCAETILHDFTPLSVMPTSSSNILPSPISLNSSDWPSVAAAVAEASYRIPSEFDFSRLQRLVIAKRQEAEHHIWSLREDPGYFQDFVYNCSEHRPEQILSINGKKHPDLGKPAFWERTLDWIVTDAYSSLIMWDLAEKELVRLAQLRDSYGSRITPNQRMPVDYERALCYFRELIQRMRYASLATFQQGISSSPQLRHYYVYKPLADGNMAIYPIEPENRRHDYFLWFIERFRIDEQMQLYGLSDLLDEFERLTRSKTIIIGAPQNKLISSWIAAALSGLAVVSEIERQLEFHQPPITLSTLNENELDAEFQRRTILTQVIFQAGRGLSLADAATPLTKFTYPADKRRTATTVQKMRQAENNLDRFWQTVDDHYSRKLGTPFHNVLDGILIPRQLERTQEWVEPTQPVRMEESKSTSSASIIDDFSTFILEDHPSPAPLPVPKVKIKTRGPATELNIQTPLPESLNPESVLSTVIKVNKRAYTIFSSIFFNPAQTTPGELPWTDFLYALSSAGFAIQKQHGSAWLFSPLDQIMRPIIFHEPHPSSKIPIHIVRRHGRRLRLAYGWTSKTFVLEE